MGVSLEINHLTNQTLAALSVIKEEVRAIRQDKDLVSGLSRMQLGPEKLWMITVPEPELMTMDQFLSRI